MPFEIAGEALGGIARLLVRFFVEVVFEFFLQGTGYVLLRVCRPRIEPSEVACVIAGLLFWACLIAGGFWLYSHLTIAA